ncbi:MAG: hypothetical protein JWL75_162 [Parcubacteria group bacterium]|nr:hypothetical protein [Parcubacteria group bacterium]
MYVPKENAEELREAIGNAGAGKIGNYTHCTFTIKGTGRSKPGEGANPAIGEVGKLVEIAEDRIETVCEADALEAVLAAIKRVHPYEEPATDVYPIEVFE